MVVKESEHVGCVDLLNHAHELLDSGSDSLTIQHGHQVVDQRLLVRNCDEFARTKPL